MTPEIRAALDRITAYLAARTSMATTDPQPPDHIDYSPAAYRAIHGTQLPPVSELLYNGFMAYRNEVPLVVPPWARTQFPELGDAIDLGLELRRAAGLDTEGGPT